MLRRLSVLPTLLLLSATSAFAQLGDLQAPNIEYNPILLINASVQKELGLSSGKASKIQKTFLDEAMKLIPSINGGTNGAPPTAAQRKSAMMAGIMRMQSRLAALLTPAQRVRLRQLTLQSIGPAAVLQPRVANALGLSPSQRSSLQISISAANSKITTGSIQGSNAQDMNARLQDMSRLQEQSKVAGARALAATLTPAQKAKWRELLGKPFPLKGFLGLGNGLPMGG